MTATVALLTLALGAAVLSAQGPLTAPVSDRAFSKLRWRLVGPFRGGRVLAAAGVPGDARTFFFGAVDGGVWRTTNAGVTWEPLFDDQPIASVGALALAPSDPNTIYVGTGEAAIRSDITFGAGVFKSTDGGAHWEHLGLDDTRHIGRVLVDPRSSNVVWVAALGHAYGPNDARGVFRSADGGRTWAKVLSRGPDVGAIDLGMDPADPDVVFAALYQARRTPWDQYPPAEGPGSGLLKTMDGGRTWTPIVGNGFPAGPLGRIGVALSRTATGLRVYAVVGAQRGAGLYRSDDGGATWQLMSADPRLTSREWYFNCVTVDPKNPDVVYVPNVSLLRSVDGGRTFVAIKGAPGGDDYHFLWIDPLDASRMIVGADQGATISLDGGRSWSSWYNQPTGQFYHVVTDDRFPYRIYGAQQDAGTAEITSRSNDGSITFRDWHPVGAGESGYIAPDPLDSNIVYGGDTYGGLFRFDRRTGLSQIIDPSPLGEFGTPMPQRRLRFTWTSPVVFDPRDGRTLYMGAQMVLRSSDGGLHWGAVSPDLTGARADGGAGDSLSVANAAARGWGVVYTIAPSPVRSGVIWAGTDDGLIHVTADSGRQWRDVTPPGLEPWSKVTLIEASPFDAAAAYAAVDRHQVDDFAPYLYRTRDGGSSWTRIDRGIPPNSYVQVVRADPARPGLLYAGTELGVFVSFDDGEQWSSLQLNLPRASVRDLTVKRNDLVAATHGRSIWVLDDVTPLRQFSDLVWKARVSLLRPARAVRLRRSTNNDTPLPAEEPHGENPPTGAVIDYYLGTPSAGAVTLEIRDAGGRLVRRFSSGDRVATPVDPPQFSADWLPRSVTLTRDLGHNRFVWDLRYPAPLVERYGFSIAAIAGRGTVAEPQGPLVLPGRYELRLSAGDTAVTAALEVGIDPRVPVADSTLGMQLRFSLAIWNSAAEQDALHRAAAALGDRLHALDVRRLDPDSKASAAALTGAVDSVARATTDPGYGRLVTVSGSADREPTQPARDAFLALRADLDRQRRRWTRIVTVELPALVGTVPRSVGAGLSAQAVAPVHLEIP